MLHRLSLLVAHDQCCDALRNGLGQLPGLGWNSDYCTNCSSSQDFANYNLANGFGVQGFNGPKTEEFIKHIADYFNSSGLQALGYHYVNMDATWDEPKRDADGNLVPKKNTWPSGLDKTIQYVHSKGLGFGLCMYFHLYPFADAICFSPLPFC